MDPVSSEVKREGFLCAGCLSSDRTLFPLREVSLFMYLLGQDVQFGEEILLCWECTGQIKMICRFQQRVRKAQLYLKLSHLGNNVPETLSRLEPSKLGSIDICPDDQTITDEVYTEIMTDIHPMCNTDLDTAVVEIKEEPCFDYDDSFDHDIDDEKESKVKIEGLVKKEITGNVTGNRLRINRYTKKAKITKNTNLDLDNCASHFEGAVLSESDIKVAGTYYNLKGKNRSNQDICKPCKKKFSTKLDAHRHKTFIHELKEERAEPWKCLECKQIFPDKDSLRTHWDTHNKVNRCKFCQEAVGGGTYNLKFHLQKHLLVYTCKECAFSKRSYFSYADFSMHFKTVHVNHYCDYCQKNKLSKASLEKHIKLHHMPPSCPVCKRHFTRHQHLTQHIASFHPELNEEDGKNAELNYCVECDKQFGSYCLYKKHLDRTKTHNPAVGSRKKFVPCPECGRVFTRTSYMRNHYKQVHKKQSEHYCRLCDKILFSAWSLKTHIAGVHMKVRLPKTKVCDICGRAFSTNAVLIKHRRTHTGERPYRCTHCPAAFTQGTPLKSHLRTQHKVF